MFWLALRVRLAKVFGGPFLITGSRGIELPITEDVVISLYGDAGIIPLELLTSIFSGLWERLDAYIDLLLFRFTILCTGSCKASRTKLKYDPQSSTMLLSGSYNSCDDGISCRW